MRSKTSCSACRLQPDERLRHHRTEARRRPQGLLEREPPAQPERRGSSELIEEVERRRFDAAHAVTRYVCGTDIDLEAILDHPPQVEEAGERGLLVAPHDRVGRRHREPKSSIDGR
jgi:hypothetical protein